MTEVSSPPEYARTMRLGLDIVDRASQQRQDDRFLGVEPVLRLVERDRVRAVEHRVGNLLAPVGRQAVHDQHRGLREAHDRLVDLVAAERLLTPHPLRLLSHARPRVGVDHVRDRLARAQADLRTREVDGAPAELDDPDLEGDAGPEGRLLEDQRHRAAGERRAAPSRLPALLEVRGEMEDLERRVARQVRRREKVAHHALRRSAVSTISSARSQWSSSMIRGGTRRSTFSPADRTRSPAFRQASRMGLTGRSSSTPMSRPRPRTSRIPTGPCANRLRPSMRRRPIRAARSGIFSPSTVWSVASATEVTNGVPPNVEPCVPGPSARATSSRVSMAPIGTPLASALARVMTSGSIPECSYAQSVPVRPTPVWTSSRIRRAPDASQSLRSPGR